MGFDHWDALAGLVTAGLVVATPVLVGASPASAATIGSTVTLNPPSTTTLEYGDSIYLSGVVKGADGRTPNSPVAVYLQVSTPAAPAWTNIAVDDSAYFSFSDLTAASNASYKVVYVGGTSGSTHLQLLSLTGQLGLNLAATGTSMTLAPG